ncbi:cell death abnormality protein 1-like [Ostrea edulis]|uniref:cell death abnormality protein 1-like n=1 Tax=Ostrea edulis TaxID=37623 RepID=UPI0024AEB7B4|nr:cell death abnormality protein 1-like [Ostrea edulis]
MDARVLILMWFTMAIIRQGVNSNKDACNKFNSTCCYNYYFDEMKDICVECKPGTFGWNCKEDCVSGYYGYLCQNECKCEEQHCDSATGCTKNIGLTAGVTGRQEILTLGI